MAASSASALQEVAWILEEFPARLRQARVAHGLEAAALASMVGIPVAEFAELECGSHAPRPTVLLDLARVLSVSVAWFLGETADPCRKPSSPRPGSLAAIAAQGPGALAAYIRDHPPEVDMDEFALWDCTLADGLDLDE